MKPEVIQQIEQLLQCEIGETHDIKAIYGARSGPLSDWGDPIQSVFFCNDQREFIGLNLADEEAVVEMDEEDLFSRFPVLPHLQVLNLSRTTTFYYNTDYGNCTSREDHKHKNIDIFPFLAKLSNLHTFIHIGNKFLHCACFIPKLPQLTHLYLNFNAIHSLNWLQNVENVEYLDLKANVITDIEPLRNLKKLKHLYLGSPGRSYKRQNNITDISPLEQLTELESLDLDSNDVQNLDVLKNLPQLKSLSLNTVNRKTDFNLLRELNTLEKLLLIGNDISDFDFLISLQHLTYLDISNNPIRSLKPLSQLTNLTYLRMYNCHLSSLSFSEVFENLQALTKLDLSDNRLKEFTFLSNLPNLEELNLKSNSFRDISVFQSLTKLKKLDLSGNPYYNISNLSVFRSLPNLEELNIFISLNVPYPPIWYVYLKVKKGKLGDYLDLEEPEYIQKIWQLLSSRDEEYKLLAIQLAKGQGWGEEKIAVYQEFEKKYGYMGH